MGAERRGAGHHPPASAKAGLVLVNINPAYRLSELEHTLNTVSAKALITAAALKFSDYLEMLSTLCPEIGSAGPGELHAARVPGLSPGALDG